MSVIHRITHMPVVGVKAESAWKFITSTTGGGGAYFVSAEGGGILLKDPKGNNVNLRYGGLGVGKSKCMASAASNAGLPKQQQVSIPVVSNFSANVAPSHFENGGIIYVTKQCRNAELTRSNLSGICMFAEVGGGFMAGGTAMAMFMGISPWILPQLLVPIVYLFISLVL